MKREPILALVSTPIFWGITAPKELNFFIKQERETKKWKKPFQPCHQPIQAQQPSTDHFQGKMVYHHLDYLINRSWMWLLQSPKAHCKICWKPKDQTSCKNDSNPQEHQERLLVNISFKKKITKKGVFLVNHPPYFGNVPMSCLNFPHFESKV